MNILVTGGAGFIGTNLCWKLLQDKNNIVYCLDNFYSSDPKNIFNLYSYKNFNLIRADIIEGIPLSIKIDVIYHLACPASPPRYQKDPIFTLKTCTIGTINVLEFAVLNRARILYASTSEIYGDPLVNPQREEYWGNVNCHGDRSCYDEGKRIGESLCLEYQRKYKLEVRIARIFNTFGEFMDIDDGRVVTNFIKQCLRNEDITVYGTGKQTRSLCYISDTVDGLMKLMESNYSKPLNIGNNHEMTILEIADIIRQLTNSQSKIVYKDKPSDDPMQRCPDLTNTNKILDWSPKINPIEGLKTTIKYYMDII